MESKYKFEMGAGRVSLDFCNSVDERPAWLRGDFSPHGEHLESADDLAAWLTKAGVLSRAERDGLPKSGATMLPRALQLRELLFRAFFEAIHRDGLSKQTLEELNRWHRLIPPTVLVGAGRGVKEVPDAEVSPQTILLRVFSDALDLLRSDALERVKFCAAEDCGWLFFDSSKNGSRRWCDMTDCGNRAKARRFQERHA
jgi:predicted RNA-binding Zn ribbon-like protein